jgi:transcriptional regulator with XRE-family HTH domain
MYSNNLRLHRLRKGLSQEEFAEKIGISRSTLSKIENGSLDIKISLLQKIMSELDIGFNDVFEQTIYLSDSDHFTNQESNYFVTRDEIIAIDRIREHEVVYKDLVHNTNRFIKRNEFS